MLPLDGVEEEVAAHVPAEVTVTVTASPKQGLERTLRVAEEIARAGHRVSPHLSARLVRDRAHLAEIMARLDAAGVDDVFVVAGDVQQPCGAFEGSAALLAAMEGLGRRPAEVGITGYPESHRLISDEETIQAMFAKEPLASYIVSQICFDAEVIGRWIARVRARGTELPILIGLPGPVDQRKLLRISTRIGVGQSVRFLRSHGSWLRHLALPGRFRPERLLEQLAPHVGDAAAVNVTGVHLYTFNEVAKTERWRQEMLERLATAAG